MVYTAYIRWTCQRNILSRRNQLVISSISGEGSALKAWFNVIEADAVGIGSDQRVTAPPPTLPRRFLSTTLSVLFGSSCTVQVFSAMVELGLRQRDHAFETLTEMLDIHSDAGLQGLGQYHAFDALRADSRFQKLLAKTP
jgi:hypothetical protein